MSEGTLKPSTIAVPPVKLVDPRYVINQPSRFGMMLCMRFDGFQTGPIALYGEYAKQETDLLLSLIKPGDTVLDVGANIGSMTLAFAAAVSPGGHVLAFEPQLYPCECLRANIMQNSLRHFVTPYRMALGDHIGEIDCPVLDPIRTNNFGGCSLVDPTAHTAQIEKIPMTTIDSLDLPRCDLIKADVEGMEAAVLRGARETIIKYQPILWVEQLEHREGTKEALAEVFAEHDYRAWHIDTPLYSPDNIRVNRENPFQMAGELMKDTNVLALPSETNPPEWVKGAKEFK